MRIKTTIDPVTVLIQNKLTENNMTVKELAKKLNVTDRTLNNRWKDSNGWTRKQLIELSNIFNFSIDEKMTLLN